MTDGIEGATIDDRPIPAVRQNRNRDHWQFGCVAVAGTGAQQGRWLIGNPEHGGHWASDDEVSEDDGWESLQTTA